MPMRKTRRRAKEHHNSPPTKINKAKENRLRKRLLSYEEAVNSIVLGKADQMRGITLVNILGGNMALIGPPGVGKTHLVKAWASNIEGARLFKYQLSKFTKPDELLGNLSLQALKKDEVRYNVTGRMPAADVAILEEMFKGSSAVTNALLTLMEERAYFEMGETISTPLRFVVGCSNEIPDQDSAIWDRIIARYFSEPLDLAQFRQIVQSDIRSDWRSKATIHSGKASFQDYDEAMGYASRLAFSADAWDAFSQVLSKLTQAKIYTLPKSDRRKVYCTRWLKAAAWLRGAKQVEAEDVTSILPLAWGSPEEISGVQSCFQGITRTRERVQEFQDMFRTEDENYLAEFEHHREDGGVRKKLGAICKAYKEKFEMLKRQVDSIVVEMETRGFTRKDRPLREAQALHRRTIARVLGLDQKSQAYLSGDNIDDMDLDYLDDLDDEEVAELQAEAQAKKLLQDKLTDMEEKSAAGELDHSLDDDPAF